MDGLEQITGGHTPPTWVAQTAPTVDEVVVYIVEEVNNTVAGVGRQGIVCIALFAAIWGYKWGYRAGDAWARA